MIRYLVIDVPCIECGGEGGAVSDLLDVLPADVPVIRPGDEMPVITYKHSRFAVQLVEGGAP